MDRIGSGAFGFDLNDPETLKLYSELLLFQHDKARESVTWDKPDIRTQGTLHNLAGFLNLQYEYSLSTRVATLSRTVPEPVSEPGLGTNDLSSQSNRELYTIPQADLYGTNGLEPNTGLTFGNEDFSPYINFDDMETSTSFAANILDETTTSSSFDFYDWDISMDASVGTMNESPSARLHEADLNSQYQPVDAIKHWPKSTLHNPESKQFHNSPHVAENDFDSFSFKHLHLPTLQQANKAVMKKLRSVVTKKGRKNTAKPPSTYQATNAPQLYARTNHPVNLPLDIDSRIAPTTSQDRNPPTIRHELAAASTLGNSNQAPNDNPRPHICDTCQRTFARLEHLKRHMRSHTKEKPFECRECARCFARKDLLLRHLNKLHRKLEHGTGYIDRLERKRTSPYVSGGGPSDLPASHGVTGSVTSFDSFLGSRRASSIDSRSSKRKRSGEGYQFHQPDTPSNDFASPTRRLSITAADSVSSFASSYTRQRTPSTNAYQSKPRRASYTRSIGQSYHSASSYESLAMVQDWSSELMGTYRSVAGRQGPLSEEDRVDMNIIRTIRACWRCKALKKKCTSGNPCDNCTDGSLRTIWSEMPCRRGDINANVLQIVLCPRRQTYRRPLPSEDVIVSIHPDGAYLERLRQRRNDELRIVGNAASTLCRSNDFVLEWPHTHPLYESCRHFPIQFFHGSSYSDQPLENWGLAATVPLRECVLHLVWAAIHSPSCRQVVDDVRDLDGFVKLCYYGASLQSNTTSLVTRSLFCLRSCFDALCAEEAGYSKKSHHYYCHSGTCNVTCLSEVVSNIDIFLTEFSRSMFKAAPRLKSDITTWWLSVFYSICIQGYVRSTLIRLRNYSKRACKEYMHLPVRLFTAMYSNDDPVFNEGNDWEVMNVRDVVRFHEWQEMGIRSSSDYLKALLEDKGAALSETRGIVQGGIEDNARTGSSNTLTSEISHGSATTWPRYGQKQSTMQKFVEAFAKRLHLDIK